MRNYQQEHQDNKERQYAYEFDTTLRFYMMRSFEPFLPEGKALELGCYKGNFTKTLSSHYTDLTVVEAAEDLIAEARSKVPDTVQFHHSTFETVNLSENTYDAIFLMHTLEHLDDPIVVLKKVKGWLKPQGRLFLVVPNANAPSRQIAVKMGLISHNAAVTPAEKVHGHRCTYTFDTLERDALAGGLSVIHRGGIFFKPLANYQFDRLMQETDIISQEYLEGCYQLGMQYPDLCASIFLLCGKGSE
ncbi:MAG: class I SAM-dependent methyltransferase [Cyanobacteria bacterium]|nr:class I SAM-dependent methyltransferase [Cyanobacteriota bacterium]